jgi:hypothetical protein
MHDDRRIATMRGGSTHVAILPVAYNLHEQDSGSIPMQEQREEIPASSCTE